MFYYLRAAFILCKPDGFYRHDAIDKILPDGNQCFISHTPTEVKYMENARVEDICTGDDEEEGVDESNEGARIRKYHCPAGFELSELRWSGGNSSAHGFESINMYFCCRQNANNNGASGSEKSDMPSGAPQTYPLPFYLRSVPTFAIIILGESCPDFSDQGTKLTADFVSDFFCQKKLAIFF